MSKLDDIQYAAYEGNRPERKDGTFIAITPETREAIKAVFLELVGEDEPETFLAQSGTHRDESKVGANRLRAELREKVSDL